MTWNSCKKSHHSASGICKQFKASVGVDTIVALQEVCWHTLAGKGYHGFVVFAWENSEVAFLIPRRWVSGIAAEKSGSCWASIALHDTIFVSAHILEHCIADGRGEQAVTDIVAFVDSVRRQTPGKVFNIVIGIDANVTLLPNVLAALVASQALLLRVILLR